MPDGCDVKGLAVVVEAEPVVANAKAEFGRLDVLEALHISFAGRGEESQGAQNA